MGSPPPHHEHVGHCSQLATFTRTVSGADLKGACASLGSPYKLVGVIACDCLSSPCYDVPLQIAECVHPHQTNLPSVEEKLRSECDYYLHLLLKRHQREDEDRACGEEATTTLVALKELLVFPRINALCNDVQDIRYVISCTLIF